MSKITNKANASNPHWVGIEPAWDITLSNGEVHKSVTTRKISVVLGKLCRAGKIGTYDARVSVVRQCHIEWYNEYYTMYK